MEYGIEGMSGVEAVEQRAGFVKVLRDRQSTIVTLTVQDGLNVGTVHLDYRQVAQLMMALGASAVDL